MIRNSRIVYTEAENLLSLITTTPLLLPPTDRLFPTPEFPISRHRTAHILAARGELRLQLIARVGLRYRIRIGSAI